MRGSLLVCALFAGGCDQVFSLERDPSDDAPTGPDAPPGCWDPNLQKNEDGDTYLDGCDPCPADLDTADILNMDGDGLADDCDPRPTTGTQTPVTFDGFAGNVGWTSPTLPTWSFNGKLVQSDVTTSHQIQRPIPPTRNPGADVRFEVPPTSGAVAGGGVGFTLGAFYVDCEFEARAAPNEDRFVLRVNKVVVGQVNVFGAGTVRIQLFQDAAGTFHCMGTKAGKPYGDLTADVTAQTTATVQLQTTTAVVEFLSILIYRTE